MPRSPTSTATCPRSTPCWPRSSAIGVDIVVNLGDILSGPLWPHETALRLRALHLPTIAGNHERQVLRQPRERMGAADRYAADALDDADRAWLEGLPPTLALHPEVFCCHGTPSTDLQYLLETAVPGFGIDGHPGVRAATGDEVRERLGDVAVPVVLCGHSHMPRLLQAGRTVVVNPGSVGLQAFEDQHGHRHFMEPAPRWRAGPCWSAATPAGTLRFAPRPTTSSAQPPAPKPTAAATGPTPCAPAASGWVARGRRLSRGR